jgi:hypothetical protein
LADAVFAPPDAPDAPEVPELPELLLDELQAAARSTSAARTAALRIVRARMYTPGVATKASLT